MSLFTIQVEGGPLVEVLRGSISMPQRGDWIAHLELGVDAAITGRVTIIVTAEDGSEDRFQGFVAHGGPYEGRAPIVIRGGVPGLVRLTSADHERAGTSALTAHKLIGDLIAAAEANEAPGLGNSLSGRAVTRWSRASGETWMRAIDRAASQVGVAWRVLADGSVWAGIDAWDETALDGRELDVDMEDRRIDVSFTRATARPGTQVGGRCISRVTFDTEGRAALYLE